MTASDYIIDVSEADFEQKVLIFSQQLPVIVDFWAEWCNPCKTLGPLLERLTIEAQGSIRLAKLNVDENQNLTIRYGVHSIPAIKAFRDGKIVSEFVGIQPESRIREFIHSIIPDPSDLIIEKGNSMLEKSQWKSAEAAFKDVLKTSPSNSRALLGLAKSYLFQNKYIDALAILNTFPASKEYNVALNLLLLTNTIIQEKDRIPSDNPLDAAYNRAIQLFIKGNYPAAMDGLIDIIRENKNFHNGEPRLVLLAIFDLFGENHPLTQQYRQELTTILF
ncbi:MAG: thioredoxin [Chloroflexi bacterium]|nr:thioredoxin [Chloroflexota bacterium]